MSRHLPDLLLHFQGRANSRIVVPNSSLQPAHREDGTIPLHGRNTFGRPTRSHPFCLEIPNLHESLACPECHNIRLIRTTALDDLQITMTLLQFTQLSNLFGRREVLVMYPVPPAEEKDVLQ